MATPTRGEVWIADLGIAGKVRPVLVLSVGYSDRDYALLAVVPHTTSPRGAAFEVSFPVRGLKAGAFNVQGMLAVPTPKLIRKVAELSRDQMASVEFTVKSWLGLTT
jgi:mRNA interferase MazF